MTLPSGRAPGRQQPGGRLPGGLSHPRPANHRSFHEQDIFRLRHRQAGLAAYAWISLHQEADLVEFTEKTRVPQLNAMAELELNGTQTSLQLLHAMLARNPQELQATLQSIDEKRKHMVEVLGAFRQAAVGDRRLLERR